MKAYGSGYVWVVEMLGYGDRWHPTVGVGLTRSEASDVLNEFQRLNSSDRYRVRRYWREP